MKQRNDWIIHPSASFRGKITPPADKSITQRAVLMACFVQSNNRAVTRIERPSLGEDSLSALGIARQLADVRTLSENGTDIWEIQNNPDKFKKCIESDATLDCGNSGTTMRLLMGLLAGRNARVTLIGDDSLNARPMRRIADPLVKMGADIRLSETGSAPVEIHPVAGLNGIEYQLPVLSAQLQSAILFAGLSAHDDTTVLSRWAGEVSPMRDHTQKMLTQAGISLTSSRVDVDTFAIELPPNQASNLQPLAGRAPGDTSSAAFALIGAALMGVRTENGEIEVLEDDLVHLHGVCVNPTRIAGLQTVLEIFGFKLWLRSEALEAKYTITHIDDSATVSLIPKGVRRVISAGKVVEIDASEHSPTRVIAGKLTASVIDEIPALAVLASAVEGKTEFRDASELRLKETDRIEAIVKGLRALGVAVEETEDGFSVIGSGELHALAKSRNAVIDCCDDHRIAMAFALAGLRAKYSFTLTGGSVASVSYPDFTNDMQKLGLEIQE